ncbi:hypothetical protein FHR71_005460 [Methylobacterium sp. RAS18]|nr:hypothetical protein [Methylobacterium sp. RAS18]
MLALAQDLLAAGIALALYVAGALLALGRCERLAPPAPTFSRPNNDNGERHVRAAPGR